MAAAAVTDLVGSSHQAMPARLLSLRKRNGDRGWLPFSSLHFAVAR